MSVLLRRCQECGHPLGRREVFCPRCGAKQPREPKRVAAARQGIPHKSAVIT
jgi:uncharacterized Zn finger protein (UPF0148 family)